MIRLALVAAVLALAPTPTIAHADDCAAPRTGHFAFNPCAHLDTSRVRQVAS